MTKVYDKDPSCVFTQTVRKLEGLSRAEGRRVLAALNAWFADDVTTEGTALVRGTDQDTKGLRK